MPPLAVKAAPGTSAASWRYRARTGALHGTVAGDIGVDDGGAPGVCQPPAEVHARLGADLLPAMDGHIAVLAHARHTAILSPYFCSIRAVKSKSVTATLPRMQRPTPRARYSPMRGSFSSVAGHAAAPPRCPSPALFGQCGNGANVIGKGARSFAPSRSRQRAGCGHPPPKDRPVHPGTGIHRRIRSVGLSSPWVRRTTLAAAQRSMAGSQLHHSDLVLMAFLANCFPGWRRPRAGRSFPGGAGCRCHLARPVHAHGDQGMEYSLVAQLSVLWVQPLAVMAVDSS